MELPKIGTRKLYFLLQDSLERHHIKIGRDALFDLLYTNAMLIRKRKKRVFKTNAGYAVRTFPNLIKKLTVNVSNMVWVSDITYVRALTGFVYLFLITDAYSKKIVGYCLSKNLMAINAIRALKMALRIEKPSFGLIHHSDRGIQYGSKDYVNLLKENNIGLSMTKGGSPQENAVAERVNGILKNEILSKLTTDNIQEIRKEIKRAIYIYNEKRPHLSCNMLTPSQAHKTIDTLQPLWKNYKKRKKYHIIVDNN